MNKIFTLFKREYRAAVRTKSFIISLLLVPIMMGGGFAAVIIMQNKQDNEDKNFVVVDHSGLMAEPISAALERMNQNEILDPETGEQVNSAFKVEFVAPSTDVKAQQRELSNRVKSTELHAVMEIGPDILHPSKDSESYLRYYSEHAFGDDMRYWFRNIINDQLRVMRVSELNL